MPSPLYPAHVKARIAALGLTEESFAARCALSLETFGAWLAGRAVLRPRKVLEVMDALGLPFEEVFGPPEEVAEIVPLGQTTPGEFRERAEDCAIHLRQLSHYLGTQPLFEALRLRNPVSTVPYAHSVAASLAGRPGAPMPQQKLLQVLRGLGVVFVPCPGGADSEIGTAFAVYVPETDRRFLVLNLGVPHATLNHALAAACGYFLARHELDGEELTLFTRALADKLSPLESYATETTFQALFSGTVPAPSEFVKVCEQWFQTPIFKALTQFQGDEGGRNHAFVARTFCAGISDGYGLSGALWTEPLPGY